MWVGISLMLYYALSIRSLLADFRRGALETSALRRRNHDRVPLWEKSIDYSVASVMAIIMVQLVYDKWADHSLIYLLQPCHLMLVIQAAALLRDDALWIQLPILTMPYLAGTLLAVFVPATSGLSKREVILYFIQHYLLNLVPFWLLCRRKFSSLLLCNHRVVFAGTWLFNTVQWTFYESLALLSGVNIQFMLCPTQAMQEFFSQLSSFLLLPSYRSFIVFTVGPLSIILSYMYIQISRIIASRLLSQTLSEKRKKK